MSPKTARPGDTPQRAACIAAIAMFFSGSDEDEEPSDELLTSDAPEVPHVPKVVRVALGTMFAPVQGQYLEVLENYRVALSVEEAATLAADRSDQAFDRSFRRWAKTVLDSEGKAMPQEISKLLGGVRPGKLVNLPYREEVDLTAYLFEQLLPLPHLKGNRKRLVKLVDAHDALSEAVSALERSERARRTARSDLNEAIKDFDNKWMTLVDLFETNCPDVAEKILPAFPVRSHKPKAVPGKGGKKGKKGEGPIATSPTEPEGDPEEDLDDAQDEVLEGEPDELPTDTA